MSNVDERSLEERLNALETEKRGRGLLASSLSVVAVLVSLVTGGFTVYDRVVERPRAEMNARVDAFARTMAEIASVRTEHAQRSAEASSPMAAQAISFATVTQIQGQLATAEQQVTAIEGRARPDQYLALAENNNFVGDYADGVRFADAALADATDPIAIASAYRFRATGLLNRPGGPDVSAVRAALEAAGAALVGQEQFRLSISRGNLIVDRIVLEYGFGDCAAVPALIAALRETDAATDMTPEARADWGVRLAGTERTWPGRCPTPLALTPPQPPATEAPAAPVTAR